MEVLEKKEPPTPFFFHSQAPPTHMHMDRWIVELYYRRKYAIKIILAKNRTIEKQKP